MWISGWICLALFASFGLLTRFYFKLRHLRSINVILETSFAVVFIVSPLVQSFPNAIRANGPDQTHNSPYSNNKRGPFLNKWFVNFVLNNFAVHANSKFQFVRATVNKVHSQILTIQNKPQRKPNCQLEIPWHKKCSASCHMFRFTLAIRQSFFYISRDVIKIINGDKK